MLERVHLKILFEVERSGSVTRAARTLSLTQSALSHSIKKLEQQLGVAIWQRQGRGLRLTHAGEVLLALAERSLPQFDDTEQLLAQLAQGKRGVLRIGMECHPCYQWLLKVVDPYMAAFPLVDLDVRQRFQFGGIGALFAHEIDLLITPDPLKKRSLRFEPVFDYEQVLVVAPGHRLAGLDHVVPEDLEAETLITYPVEKTRLDVFAQFLLPAAAMPRIHRTIETTEIMLKLVACGRGVAALPDWLVRDLRDKFDVVPLRLGKHGIKKQIHLGYRTIDRTMPYVTQFISLAKSRAFDETAECRVHPRDADIETNE